MRINEDFKEEYKRRKILYNIKVFENVCINFSHKKALK